MVLLPASVIFLSISILAISSLVAWLALRLYVLQIFLSYHPDRLSLVLELGYLSRKALSVFMCHEDRQWVAGVRTARRSLWQHSWAMPAGIPGRRMYRRWRSLWKHPKRPAWMEALRRLLVEIYEQLRCRQVSLNVRLGLPSYLHTGCLAAVAYPLNFTLFRCLGVFRPRVIPDFTTRGFGFENQIRFTFRGYQLWRPSYHFLRSPVVRDFLWNRLSQRTGRITGYHHTNRRKSANT